LARDQTEEPLQGPPPFYGPISVPVPVRHSFGHNLLPKYIKSQQMHSNIYYAFYSLCPHPHVSANIPTIFRKVILLQESDVQVIVHRDKFL